MDRTVTIRFYEIEHPANSERFEDILQRIDSLPKREREGELDDGAVVLRLEHLRHHGNIYIGDITRVQTQHLPGHVIDDDVEKLPVDEIGHSTVFLYDTSINCLACQFDMRTGISRITRYLRIFAHNSPFRYFPYLKSDTLARFEHQSPTKLRLRIARVRNFEYVPARTSDFEEQFRIWADYFDAPSIEIIISTQRQGKHLNSASVWNTVRRWIGFREEIEGIKNIEAETIESDEGFNFIKDLLCEEATLNLPDNDPEESRRIRLAFLAEIYERHFDYLSRVSGAS